MSLPLNVSAGAPPETPEQLTADSLRLVGSTTVCGTFYGFMTVCAGACVHRIWLSRRRLGLSAARVAFQLSFVGLLWICGTIAVACMAQEVDTVYVQHRLFEPGPYAYVNFDMPSVILVDTAYYVSMVIADGVMVWRFKVIWHDWPLHHTLLALVVLTYAVSVGACLVALITASVHCAHCPQITSHSIPLGFTSSIVLNVLTTALMAGKLYKFRNRIIKAPLSHSTPSLYVHIAALLVESCALYTAFSLAFVVLNRMHHAGQYVAFGALAQVQAIAPLLVVFRISDGTAWREGQDAGAGSVLDGEGQNTLEFSRTGLAGSSSEGHQLEDGEGGDGVTEESEGEGEGEAMTRRGSVRVSRNTDRRVSRGSARRFEIEEYEMQSMGSDTLETVTPGVPSSSGCGEGSGGKLSSFKS